jgi:hypothetical protein
MFNNSYQYRNIQTYKNTSIFDNNESSDDEQLIIPQLDYLQFHKKYNKHCFSYFFVSMCLLIFSIVNLILLIYVLTYIQQISDEASILSNSSLISSIDKLEEIIDFACKNIIKNC